MSDDECMMSSDENGSVLMEEIHPKSVSGAKEHTMRKLRRMSRVPSKQHRKSLVKRKQQPEILSDEHESVSGDEPNLDEVENTNLEENGSQGRGASLQHVNQVSANRPRNGQSNNNMRAGPSGNTSTSESSSATRIEESGASSHAEQLGTILDVLKKMQGDSLEFKARLESMEEKKSEERRQKVQIPRNIVAAVHDGYKQAKDEGLCWTIGDGIRWYSTSNAAMNEHIRQFIKGQYPSADPAAVGYAMKRYYQTKKEEHGRKKNNKSETHKQRQLSYERKREKARRRLTAVSKKRSWNPQKKKETRDVLLREYMSSDEDGEDGCFITRPALWRSDDFNQRMKDLDNKYLLEAPNRSRRQLATRRQGPPSEKPQPPLRKESHQWIVA